MKFSEKDAADIARLKQVMFDKGEKGDQLAASAFANLLRVETERTVAMASSSKEKLQELGTDEFVPGPKVLGMENVAPGTWGGRIVEEKSVYKVGEATAPS